MSRAFTTGQVAKICRVSRETVIKWFDSGRLKGYHIPGSQDRRIPRLYLIKFLKEQAGADEWFKSVVSDLEDEDVAKVLLVAQDQALVNNLKGVMPLARSFKVALAATGFEAGMVAHDFRPDAVVVDFSIGRDEARHICQAIWRRASFNGTFVITLFPDDGSITSVDKSSMHEAYKKPFDVCLIAERLRTLIGNRKELC